MVVDEINLAKSQDSTESLQTLQSYFYKKNPNVNDMQYMNFEWSLRLETKETVVISPWLQQPSPFW